MGTERLQWAVGQIFAYTFSRQRFLEFRTLFDRLYFPGEQNAVFLHLMLDCCKSAHSSTATFMAENTCLLTWKARKRISGEFLWPNTVSGDRLACWSAQSDCFLALAKIAELDLRLRRSSSVPAAILPPRFMVGTGIDDFGFFCDFGRSTAIGQQ